MMEIHPISFTSILDPPIDCRCDVNTDGYRGGGSYTPMSFDSGDEYIVHLETSDDIPGR